MTRRREVRGGGWRRHPEAAATGGAEAARRAEVDGAAWMAEVADTEAKEAAGVGDVGNGGGYNLMTNGVAGAGVVGTNTFAGSQGHSTAARPALLWLGRVSDAAAGELPLFTLPIDTHNKRWWESIAAGRHIWRQRRLLLDGEAREEREAGR